ncbi:phage major capsid protein [Actinomadura sp. KC345]|uniref:phage major capsid protein n=1 Tax=Actinomadura sp. KC345 TaxID=2530371 RepID=UPI00104EAD06|nr:phage major capsid protein [Actinomadura sp. KC345]TDC47646.1 phage major capsid protein [Actinomadura sp. KC345]
MTKTPIPTSANELEEMLNDGRVADLFEGGKPTPDFNTFVRNYATALQGQGTELAARVREETQLVLAEWLREHESEGVRRVNLDPQNSRSLPKTALYNSEAPGAKIDSAGLFDRPEDFLRAIHYRNSNPDAVTAQTKLTEIRNAYGSTIPADGGFLIPETLRSNLLQVALEMAIVRPRATIIPMDSLRVPLPVIDDTSHASSVYGGMIGYWTEESGALSESEASFGRVVLEALKLTGYSEVPNELFQDAIVSFQAFLNQVWPRAIAWFEDVAFISGGGAGEPVGALNGDCAVTVARATANEVNFADVVGMYARMLPASLGNAVWLANIDVFPQLAQMVISDANGVASPAVWLNNGQLIQGPPMTILGRPVIFTEKVPSLGSTGDLSLVDFSYYLVGDRQAMSIETSPHYKFKNDQTAVRIIERVDGRPWLQSAITPHQGTDTLSPIVKLGPAS